MSQKRILHIGLAADHDPARRERLSAKLLQRDRQLTLRRALAGLGAYLFFPWQQEMDLHGRLGMNLRLQKAAAAFQPDWTFMQVQRGGIVDPKVIAWLPGRVMNWSGDVREPLPAFYRELAPCVATTSFTNMEDVETMRAAGHRADYLQVGFDDDVFRPDGPKQPEAEIVFFGSNYNQRFPESEARMQMVLSLRERWGNRFRVYGRGWPPELGARPVGPEESAAIYRGCKIAINQNHFVRRRFSSDRLFRAMGGGALLLNRYFPEQECEFETGKHFDSWHTLDELHRMVAWYLSHDAVRNEMAAAGCALVHQTATWPARMQEFARIMENLSEEGAGHSTSSGSATSRGQGKQA